MVHCSSLSRSLWMSSHHSGLSSATHTLVSSTNVIVSSSRPISSASPFSSHLPGAWVCGSLSPPGHRNQANHDKQLAKGALNPTVSVTDEDIKEHQSQNYEEHYWSPSGHWHIDHHSLRTILQPVPHPSNTPPIKSISSQIGQNDVVDLKTEVIREDRKYSTRIPQHFIV